MAMPSLTSIIFGLIMASIVLFGMGQFFVGVFQQYQPISLMQGNTTETMNNVTSFVTQVQDITNVFKSNSVIDALNSLGIVGQIVGFFVNSIWSFGLFVTMPANMILLATSAAVGMPFHIPTEISGVFGTILFFLLIIGIIRMMTYRAEI